MQLFHMLKARGGATIGLHLMQRKLYRWVPALVQELIEKEPLFEFISGHDSRNIRHSLKSAQLEYFVNTFCMNT